MHSTNDIEALHSEIKQVEDWLREHPKAGWQERYDMIGKLAALNKEMDRLNTKKQ